MNCWKGVQLLVQISRHKMTVICSEVCDSIGNVFKENLKSLNLLFFIVLSKFKMLTTTTDNYFSIKKNPSYKMTDDEDGHGIVVTRLRLLIIFL